MKLCTIIKEVLSMKYMHAACTETCKYISIFGNSFLTVNNLGVLKKLKVAEKGSMYTRKNFCTYLYVYTRIAAINLKGASVLLLIVISQASYIQTENFKK